MSGMRRASGFIALMAYVYMVECNDGTYYVGSTHDLEQRVDEHNLGIGSQYTSARRPVKLVWAEEFEDVADAYAYERKVHGWGRRKRELLIARDYEALRGSGSRRKRQL